MPSPDRWARGEGNAWPSQCQSPRGASWALLIFPLIHDGGCHESKENNTRQFISESHPPGTYPQSVMMMVARGRARPLPNPYPAHKPQPPSAQVPFGAVAAQERPQTLPHHRHPPPPVRSPAAQRHSHAIGELSAPSLSACPHPAARLRGMWKISAHLTSAGEITVVTALTWL